MSVCTSATRKARQAAMLARLAIAGAMACTIGCDEAPADHDDTAATFESELLDTRLPSSTSGSSRANGAVRLLLNGRALVADFDAEPIVYVAGLKSMGGGFAPEYKWGGASERRVRPLERSLVWATQELLPRPAAPSNRARDAADLARQLEALDPMGCVDRPSVSLFLDARTPFRALIEIVHTAQGAGYCPFLVATRRPDGGTAAIAVTYSPPDPRRGAAHWEDPPGFYVAAVVDHAGVTLRTSDGNVGSGCARYGAGMAAPNRSGVYDHVAIRRCARWVKTAGRAGAQHESIALSAASDIDVQSLLSVVDDLAADAQGPLFPEIVLEQSDPDEDPDCVSPLGCSHVPGGMLDDTVPPGMLDESSTPSFP